MRRPPFTRTTALASVQAAEDAWNSHDPLLVVQACTPNIEWRDRDQFLQGRNAVVDFLTGKWTTELHHRLVSAAQRPGPAVAAAQPMPCRY